MSIPQFGAFRLGNPDPNVAAAFNSGRSNLSPAFSLPGSTSLTTPFRVENPWSSAGPERRPETGQASFGNAFQKAQYGPFGVQTPTFNGSWRQATNAAFGSNAWQPSEQNPFGDTAHLYRSPNPADAPNNVWSKGFWVEERRRAESAAATAGISGGVTNLGGKWANVDRWNAEILAAQAKVKAELGVDVPTNVIKAVMMIESQGEMLDPNYAGYYGLMQVGPGSWGVGSAWNAEQAQKDPAYNVYAGTWELGRRFQDAMQQNPAYTWSNVVSGYFSGDYTPDGSSDNYNSDYAYVAQFESHLKELSAGTVVQGGQGAGGMGAGSGNQLVQEAMKYLGNPYVWATAGETNAQGVQTFDCSGFVWYLYQQVTGQPLDMGYRDSHQQFNWGTPVAVSGLQPGDLIFHDTMNGGEVRAGNAASHVGIYIGNGQVINALNPSAGVVISELSMLDSSHKYLGARRLPYQGGYQAGVSSNPTTLGMASIWGGGTGYQVTQGFGKTQFSENNSDYLYGAGMTLNGLPMGHPGIDVGMEVGTALFSPLAGTVVIAGGSGSFRSDDNGADVPGRGELRIELENGQILILGHMDSMTVKVGDKVTPGMRVGGSGASNGGHVHVEYRIPDARTKDGYLLVDPTAYLNGLAPAGGYGDADNPYALAAPDIWKLPGWEGYDPFLQSATMPYRPWWLTSGSAGRLQSAFGGT